MFSYAASHPLQGAIPPPRVSEEEDGYSSDLSDGLPPMIDIWDIRNPFAAHNRRRIPSRIRRARRYESVGPLDSIDECTSEEDYDHFFDDSDFDSDSDTEEEDSGEGSSNDSDYSSDVEEKAGMGGDFNTTLHTGSMCESDDEEDSVEVDEEEAGGSGDDATDEQLTLPRPHPALGDLCLVYNKLADDEERRSRRT